MTALDSSSAPPSMAWAVRRLWMARAAWLLVALLALIVFAEAVAAMLPASLGLEAPETASLAEWIGSTYGQWWLLIALDGLLVLAFVGVGVVIVLRRTADWFVMAVSAALMLYGIAATSAVNRLWHGSTPWAALVNWLQLASTASVPILAYLFPDGRFVPRWTRWLALLWGAWALGAAILPALNPYGWPPALLLAFFVLVLASGLAAQAYRYRRVSTLAQRQQTKWVILGFAVGTLGYVGISAIQALMLGERQIGLLQALYSNTALDLAQALVPVCIGLSVLRYRLWDIDLVINRTIVYTIVVSILGVVFYFTGKVSSSLVESAVGRSPLLGPLASTLVSAALFTPLRERTQYLVDRQFYREKVDLQTAFAEFAHELRGASDETALLQMLVDHVSGLLHLAHAAVYRVSPDGKLELGVARDLPAALTGGWSPDPQTWRSLQRGQVAAPQDELGFALAVPLNLPAAAKQADPLAVLALGPRLSGVGFSREDHALLVTLADHAATAIYLTRSVQNAGENHR